MEEIDYEKTNVFCKVLLPNGKRLTYQFPNDLREAMLQSYADGELKNLLSGALINVPTSKYTKKGRVTLRLGKIVCVFVLNRKYRRRTRGQFLTRDNWQGKLNKANVLFLLHDHSLMNKIRIRLDLIMWRLRFKSKS